MTSDISVPQDAGQREEETGNFIIGVSGHRDLIAEDEPRTRARVRDALVQLTEASRPLVPLVITGLAEGADSLIATEALDLGLAVEAVLPMPAQDYEDDFRGEAREVFFDLLRNSAVKVREIPLSAGGRTGGRLTPGAKTRQYALLRDHILRRSNVLVALWDGLETGLKGGTGDVVTGYLGGKTETAGIGEVGRNGRVASSLSRLVVWIYVSRRQAPDRRGVEDTVFLVSDPSGDAYWRQSEIPEAIRAHWRWLGARSGKT